MHVPSKKDSQAAELKIYNVEDGETIHQRCLLITGRSPSYEEYGDTLCISVKDIFGSVSPQQMWPMAKGYFKALVLLSSGRNTINLERRHGDRSLESANLEVDYVPLLQVPPLHLAIMVAEDSPLLMDCPAYKAGGLSSTHSDLNAAISKFRVTAYMWQALTAEDMRAKGLGRRSFRLEEEFGIDTTKCASFRYRQDRSKSMGHVAKVHLVHSNKTVAELQDPDIAQQNEKGGDHHALHRYFETALKAHGGVFELSTRPVVAGMILDTSFSVDEDLLLGHAALGCRNSDGISLGVFGSHLTYSWPRFFDEIPSCLTDTTPPGNLVCNDSGECGTSWEACSIGQGAFLHEVGHAFGAHHSSGIMARGYAQDWPKNFIGETAYCEKTKCDGEAVIDGVTSNNARWDLRDALSFRSLPQFRLPGDPTILSNDPPTIRPDFAEENEANKVAIECEAGIAKITVVNGENERIISYGLSLEAPKLNTSITLAVEEYDQSSALSIEVVAINGRVRKVGNVWRMLRRKNFVRIHGSDIILQKQSVSGYMREDHADSQDTEMQDGQDDSEDEDGPHQWAVLLEEKGPDGKLSRAKAIEMRVGGIFDGAVVHYKDGHSTPCARRYNSDGSKHRLGGNPSKLNISKEAEVIKVEINRNGWGDKILGGIRMTLSDGTTAGDLNTYDDEDHVSVLQVAEGERIVGFFGTSNRCYTTEFGIITTGGGVELPPQAYDMDELKNIQAQP